MIEVEIRESEGRGLGVFALSPIPSGERIRIVNIEREVTEEQPLGPKDNPDHAFLSDGKILLVGEPDRYLNHSCNPNAGLRFDGVYINLIAIVDIQAGQEITFDYSTTMQAFGFEMACACGAPNCRGTVKDFIHIPNETQRKYIHLGIVPNYILPAGPGRLL